MDHHPPVAGLYVTLLKKCQSLDNPIISVLTVEVYQAGEIAKNDAEKTNTNWVMAANATVDLLSIYLRDRALPRMQIPDTPLRYIDLRLLATCRLRDIIEHMGTVTLAEDSVAYSTSINYPQNYPNSVSYSRLIVGPESSQLLFDTIDFSIEGSSPCFLDFVAIEE